MDQVKSQNDEFLNLRQLWVRALKKLDPGQFIAPVKAKSMRRHNFDTAYLCWGKAAARTRTVLKQTGRGNAYCFTLSTHLQSAKKNESVELGFDRTGNHPLPGTFSFYSGGALLEYFSLLSRTRVRNLTIYLSGGASSLAWVRPAHFSETELVSTLQDLYRKSISIRALNRARAKLCALKRGGAARWLAFLAPQVKAQVYILSDVAPYGPQIVGSGPFWEARPGSMPEIPHHVWADNSTLVKFLILQTRQLGVRIIQSSSGNGGPWTRCLKQIVQQTDRAMRFKQSGLVIWGGEPEISLPAQLHPRPTPLASGGRQTHLALALLIRFRAGIGSGQMQILCAASDGSDGKSGSSGAFIDASVAMRILKSASVLKKAEHSLKRFNSACFLKKLDALLPVMDTGTNVQDCVLIQIHSRAEHTRQLN